MGGSASAVVVDDGAVAFLGDLLGVSYHKIQTSTIFPFGTGLVGCVLQWPNLVTRKLCL